MTVIFIKVRDDFLIAQSCLGIEFFPELAAIFSESGKYRLINFCVSVRGRRIDA